MYEALPSGEVSYPFFFIADSQTVERQTKQTQVPTIYQTVHYYHNDFLQKGTVYAQIDDFKHKVKQAKNIDGYNVNVSIESDFILEDTTTGTSLVHGIIDVKVQF